MIGLFSAGPMADRASMRTGHRVSPSGGSQGGGVARGVEGGWGPGGDYESAHGTSEIGSAAPSARTREGL